MIGDPRQVDPGQIAPSAQAESPPLPTGARFLDDAPAAPMLSDSASTLPVGARLLSDEPEPQA
ncbi:MAG: hypothetical protein ACK4YP_01700, partial [Myxococcota bacterium]